MKQNLNFIQHLKILTKKQVILSLVFLGAAAFAFLMARYGEQVSKIGYVILFVELIIVVTITWGMAGHTVMKALFGNGKRGQAPLTDDKHVVI